MKWNHLLYRLAVAFQQLERDPKAGLNVAAKPVVIPQKLKFEERESAGRMTALVRQFCQRRCWPALSVLDRFFLRQRLRYAFYFVSQHKKGEHPFTIIPRQLGQPLEKGALEWLLLELWEKEGLSQWLHAFERWTGQAHSRSDKNSDELSFAA